MFYRKFIALGYIDQLRALLEEDSLAIDWKEDGVKRLILKKNYGSAIEQKFGMTRQGVRWRFQRLFNHIYPSAYETILWLESSFGTELRSKAMAIAKERYENHKKAQKSGKIRFSRR